MVRTHRTSGDRRRSMGRRLTASRRHSGVDGVSALVVERRMSERRSGSDRRAHDERRSSHAFMAANPLRFGPFS